MVNAALSWVLAQRRSDGLALWAVEEDDRPWDYALLTGTSSIQHALRCGAVLAGFCGEDADEWLQAADHMRDAITTRPHSFEDKSRWAMDWYYPVLSGALTESAAIARLASGWDTFIMDGLGTRCVSDGPWVTASRPPKLLLPSQRLEMSTPPLNFSHGLEVTAETMVPTGPASFILIASCFPRASTPRIPQRLLCLQPTAFANHHLRVHCSDLILNPLDR